MADDTIVPLPCPFCGNSELLVVPRTCNAITPYNACDYAYPRVQCRCGAEMAGKNWREPDTAVEAWNRRHGWQPEPIAAALARVQADPDVQDEVI